MTFDIKSYEDHSLSTSSRLSPQLMRMTAINGSEDIPEGIPGGKVFPANPVQISIKEAASICDSGCAIPINKALSTYAKDFPDEFINPAPYAYRSVEQRRQKSREEGGKISRPLNCYMLYRKAYQQVARRALNSEQQQIASQIVSDSWTRLESIELKLKFQELADVDKAMHSKAFPDYKYNPAHSKNSKTLPRMKGHIKSIQGHAHRRRRNKRTGSPRDVGKGSSSSDNPKMLLNQYQCGESNFECWPEEMQHSANMSQYAYEDEHQECFLPEKISHETQLGQFGGYKHSKVTKQSPEDVPDMWGSSVSVEPYLVPSLFAGSCMERPHENIAYWDWQPQEASMHSGFEFSHIMAMNQTAIMDYQKYDPDEGLIQLGDNVQMLSGSYESSEPTTPREVWEAL